MASNIIAPRARGDQSFGVRQELRERLPGFVQQLLTAVTGRPYEGEKPLVTLPTPVLVGLESGALGVSIAIGTLPFAGSAWALPLLPYAFCTAVGRLRWFQTELAHYGIHESMRGHRLWAMVGTVVPLSQNEKDYAADHLGEHHQLKVFGTADDPDAKVLLKFGFEPGTDEAELARRLRRTLLSPRFHGWFLMTRMKSNFTAPGLGRRSVAILWLAALIGLTAVMPFTAWLVMVAATYTVGYQSSALLQFLSEHLWLGESRFGARRAVELSQGRFCGEAPPKGGCLGWLGWFGRMLTVHVCSRLAVLPGTLPSHDAHHVSQRRINPNWKTANYVRSDMIADSTDLGMAEREVWGLGPAIRSVFRSFANS